MIHDIYGHSFEKLETESVSAFSDSLNEVGVVLGVDFKLAAVNT